VIGERVKLAREASRFTQQELAARANVSQAALSEIEAGRVMNPLDETVAKIAEATQFPVRFFYRGPLPDLPDGHYRRLARGTSKVEKQIRAQVRHIVEIVQESEQLLRLPHVMIEPVHVSDGLDAIEAVASDVRAKLGLGSGDPIPNLTRAVERAGVIVVRLPGEMPDHDSFSAWPDYSLEGRPVLALTGGHPGDRDRFNEGHELGHLVLHTLRPNIDHKQAEEEANRFAGALLIPADSAREAMHQPVTLRVLMGVKATYGVSIAMAAQRALDLQLISRPQFVSLRKQLSARRWTKVEPVEVSPEKPLLISKIIANLAGEGSTKEKAARLSMPAFSFRSLASA
jgi:Zn-dependent peptidase ImmA (M78 family)/transcriptional regulator with XRE-family HTH domain